MRAIAPPPRRKVPSDPSPPYEIRGFPPFRLEGAREGEGRRRQEKSTFLTPRGLGLLIALLAIFSLAFLQLWQSWRYLEALNEFHRAQTRVEALRTERDRLLFEVARAFSLERVERIARERLGMTRPEPEFLVLPLSR